MSDEPPSGTFSFADDRTACLDVRAVVEAWLTVAPPPPPLTPERAQAAAQLLFEAGLTPVPLAGKVSATPSRDESDPRQPPKILLMAPEAMRPLRPKNSANKLSPAMRPPPTRLVVDMSSGSASPSPGEPET